MTTMEINPLVLAYLGDSIYEVYIRKFLISQSITKVKDLQKTAVCYVSATKQAVFLNDLITKNFFTVSEMALLRRARNTKSHSHPKGCTMIEYKQATALEALIGYLTLEGQHERVAEIMNEIIKQEGKK